MTTKVYDDEFVYGSNNLGSKQMFKERVRYDDLHPSTINAQGPDPALSTNNNTSSPEPVNFWSAKYQYYGKKDQNNSFITSREKHLKQIQQEGGGVFVLNFVADAFLDFKAYIEISKANRLADDEFLTSKLEAKRGWQNINVEHDRILEAYYKSFTGVFLKQTGFDKKIIDFESFLDVFMNLYLSKATSVHPFTKAGILQSLKTTPLVSGLCIDLSLDSCEDDYIKFNKYINNINYEFYTLVAAKFGFFVDKNVPWRLVANINSPKMRPYIQKYFFTLDSQGTVNTVFNHYHDYSTDNSNNGVTSGQHHDVGSDASENFLVSSHTHDIIGGVVQIAKANGDGKYQAHTHGFISEGISAFKHYISNFAPQGVYNHYYEPAYDGDIETLRDNIGNLYKRFVSEYPTVKVAELCLPKKGKSAGYYGAATQRKTVLRTLKRAEFPQDDFIELSDRKYNFLFWMKTYLLVRITEITKGKSAPAASINNAMAEITHLYNFVDKASTMKYIDSYLKQYY
tara:strand:+ start:1586 stop:3121 length:1536 start_codon:yes stop_codon:yes gene_type:complete